MEYNYNGIVSQMQANLSLLSNWTKTLYYGVYQRLIEVMAYVIDKFIYLAEFYYVESGWGTAKKIESLMNQALFLQYKAHRKIGAIGYVQISSDPTFSASYINVIGTTVIPKWTVIQSSDGTQSCYATGLTDLSRTYKNKDIGPFALAVSEGIPKSFVYTASGISNEKITLYNNSIDNNNIEVWAVDVYENKLYQINIISNLYLSPDLTSYYCQVDNSSDFSSVIVTFGDGLTALKLNLNDNIKIFYAETKGIEGNIASTSVLTKIPSTLYDEIGNVVTLYATNSSAISSGYSIEDIESIRSNAPNLYKTGYRLGSSADWQNILNSVPYIQKGFAWSVSDTNISSITTNPQTVYITALSTSGIDLTSDQLVDLTINRLYPLKSLTESITYQPVEKVYIGISGSVEIYDTVTYTSASGVIQTGLADKYSSINSDFNTSAYQSKIWATVDNLSCVKQHKLDIFNVQKDKTSSLGVVSPLTRSEANISLYPVYSGSVITDNISIVSNSCKIWVNDSGSVKPVLIANELNGTFINVNSQYALTGTVNYLAGQNSCTYNISSGAVKDVYLSYKTKDGLGYQTESVRINKGWQITDIDNYMLILDFNTF